MRRPQVYGIVAALALVAAAPRALAWGCAGHQVVAYLAWAHLQPGVRTRAEHLLAGMPLSQAACWADQVRTATTEPYHFVNLPLAARPGNGTYARYCQGDCISSAFERFLAQLKGRTAGNRSQALYYVIHLTGDAAQPLHTADNGDRGGNCVRTRLPGERRSSDLHADWDTALLRPLLGPGGPQAYAAGLDRRFGRRFARPSPDPKAWAWQAHALAVRDAYGPLHLTPGCHAPPVRLSPAYVRRADEDIAAQLDRAGWRLAAVLNAALPRP